MITLRTTFLLLLAILLITCNSAHLETDHENSPEQLKLNQYCYIDNC